jgi:hypothetical protein
MASVSPDATGLAAPTDAGFGRRICVEVERTVDAPMERVWVVLRDYRAARPRMLTEHFADYAVQQQEGRRTVIDHGCGPDATSGATSRPSRSPWRGASCASVPCIRRW